MSTSKHFSSEQEQFSARLIKSMHDAGVPDESPSHIVREFNLRFPRQAVTVHAVRKWIKGEAIPTQEKIIALSRWLNVNPSWLRFDGERSVPDPRGLAIERDEQRILRDLRLLDPRRRAMVEEFISLLLGSVTA
ncbi:MAG: hypothetical protein V4463_15515 [Pseudomonadota bacterium]